MKHIFRTLSICVLPLLIAACNTDYNFDNISLEVTVGDTDGIAVPLGNTGTITLGDLLKEAGLETNEDGFYGFSYGDNFEYTAEVEALPSITGLIPTIAPITPCLVVSVHPLHPSMRRKHSHSPAACRATIQLQTLCCRTSTSSLCNTIQRPLSRALQ